MLSSFNLRLLTDAEVKYIYGDPAPYIGEDGRVSKAWELAILDSFYLPAPLPLSWGGVATKISCHKKVYPWAYSIFNTLWKNKLWHLIEDYGGCFEWRANKNNAIKRSRHSWGIAFDLNVKKNPNKGASNQPRELVKVFNDMGFVWGGDFADNPDADTFDYDPMHFEIGTKA